VTYLRLTSTQHEGRMKMHEKIEPLGGEESRNRRQQLAFCRPASLRAEFPEIVIYYCSYSVTVTSNGLLDVNRRLSLDSVGGIDSRKMPVQKNEDVIAYVSSVEESLDFRSGITLNHFAVGEASESSLRLSGQGWVKFDRIQPVKIADASARRDAAIRSGLDRRTSASASTGGDELTVFCVAVRVCVRDGEQVQRSSKSPSGPANGT
jgi:hypothetical protein